MADKYRRFTPGDKHIAHVLEYQASKVMDEVVFTENDRLVGLYNAGGEGGELELVMDDLIKLPDGGYVELTWDLVVVPEKEAKLRIKEMEEANA